MDATRAHDILTHREESEIQRLLERFSVCSLVNSILLVAFFMAEPTIYAERVRLALPIIGIAFSVGFIFVLCLGAKARVDCYDRLCKLEKMLHWEPHIASLLPKHHPIWKLGVCLSPAFPLLFIAIWGVCL